MAVDPFEDDLNCDELEIVSARKRSSGSSLLEALGSVTPSEGNDLDTMLAFKPLNDFGNAIRLIKRFGDILIHVENIGWYAWDETRWNHKEGFAEALKLGQRIGELIPNEARALRENRGIKFEWLVGQLISFARQSGNITRVHGMLNSAAPHLSKPVNSLDSAPFLVGAPNGTIVLGPNCELRPSDRDHLITRLLGVSYNPQADCPRWNAFIERVLPDPDIRDFVQRFIGYCLTGDASAHLLLILYGLGRNGKTVFLNILRRLLHEYATSLPATSILAKRPGGSGGEASPDLADLPGIRLVTVSEPPEGGRLDEARIKEMTGGEFAMKARQLNKGFFEFRPQFKMIIATNHRPTIRGTDKGIWSRIALIPFTAQIPEGEIDPQLEEKLWAEAEGILQWILTGTEEYFARGLALPQKIKDAVEDYRADQDPVGEFLKARCVIDAEEISPSTGKVWEISARDLREAYSKWCTEEGLEAMSGKAFGSKLSGRGIERRKSHGNKVYVGVRLIKEAITWDHQP